MQRDNVIDAIRNTAGNIPSGAKVILFGSQARGDARKDSDWDVLVLVDKEAITPAEHDLYTFPFWELGWEIDAMIHPALYTVNDWQTKANPIFRANVEKDGIVLC